MCKTGLVFEERDLVKFRAHGGFDLLLLPPGFSVTIKQSETITGIACLSLSEFIENGEISKLSIHVAPAVRDLISRLCTDSIEAKSSQNDLYQYHLRLQWLYVVALDRFFDRRKGVDIWVALQPYKNYYSPMRPDVGVLYSNARLLAYLASTLASYKGMSLRTIDARNLLLLHFTDTTRRITRKLLLKLYLSAKLVQKTLHARKRAKFLTPVPDASIQETVGIIVRTDSEVISASYLIQGLQTEGISYCVIHDEIISSTTALERLQSMGIPSVSIGSMLGLAGVCRAWFTKPGRLDLQAAASDLAPRSHAEKVLLRNEEVLDHLKDRLHDFYAIQLNFRLELSQIIDRYKVGLLVTYAYVDQWGGVIKASGDRIGIKTLAIQNAAQDPEEYPRLCWADFYCVESKYLKDRLISLGYPRDKLAATGLPQFATVDSRVVVHKDHKKTNNQLLILTQPIYQGYYNILIEACAKFAVYHGMELAIKYHPRQWGNEYDKVIQKLEPSIRINVYQKEPLDDLILKSSAVISIVSAALIRSINLGAPTISFLPVEERHLDLYYANDANLYCVSTIPKLTELLRQMKTDEEGFIKGFESRRSNYLAEHASYEPTVNSEENIMLSLLPMLKGRQRRG